MRPRRRWWWLVAGLVWLACSGDGSDSATVSTVDSLDSVDSALGDTSVPVDSVDSAPPDSQPETRLEDTAPVEDTALVEDTAPVEDTFPDASPETAAETETTTGCPGLPPGHQRHVVISYPYTAGGAGSPRWLVRVLEEDGVLGAVTAELELERAFDGVVAFRDDGGLAVSRHDDGTIGVFTVDLDGRVTVIEPHLDPGAYVDQVHIAGDHLLLVDGNWPENGGGVYRASLSCDGAVGPATRLYPAKLALGLALAGDTHVLAATEAVTGDPGTIHLVAPTGGAWTRLDGVDLFADDEDSLASLLVTNDGRFALAGDNQEFAPEIDNRIGVAALDDNEITSVGVITPLLDPVAMVASPFDDAILVVSGYGDAVRVLSYDPERDPPFADQGEPQYVTTPPALPGSAARTGDLVLVVENVAIRRFRFARGGKVVDLGRTAEGSGYDSIPGAIGIQP